MAKKRPTEYEKKQNALKPEVEFIDLVKLSITTPPDKPSPKKKAKKK